MTHFKTLLDPSEYLQPHDFEEDKEKTISRIVRETDKEGVAFRAMYFMQGDKEYSRKYKVPNIVYYGLSELLGTDIDQWPGKKITLFSTTCNAFGNTEPCIRVRFDEGVTKKIMMYMKKRKVNPKQYMIK